MGITSISGATIPTSGSSADQNHVAASLKGTSTTGASRAPITEAPSLIQRIRPLLQDLIKAISNLFHANSSTPQNGIGGLLRAVQTMSAAHEKSLPISSTDALRSLESTLRHREITSRTHATLSTLLKKIDDALRPSTRVSSALVPDNNSSARASHSAINDPKPSERASSPVLDAEEMDDSDEYDITDYITVLQVDLALGKPNVNHAGALPKKHDATDSVPRSHYAEFTDTIDALRTSVDDPQQDSLDHAALIDKAEGHLSNMVSTKEIDRETGDMWRDVLGVIRDYSLDAA